MSILKVDYFDLASLAEATYAALTEGGYLENKDALTRGGFSESQAEYLLNSWSVKTYVPNTTTGFSMSLFEGADGFVLGFRGTEPDVQWGKDLGADVGDIVSDGIALDQIIDLVNFWAWIKSDGVYTAAKLETLASETATLRLITTAGNNTALSIYLATMSLRNDVVIDFPTNTVKRVVWENSDTAFSDIKYQQGLGLGYEIAAKGLTVTGHSLGGHLASAFTRLFPGENADALTINGAGFGIVGLSGFASKNVSNLFGMLFGNSGFDGGSILNLYGEKNPEFVTQDALLKQPGGHSPVFIEQSTVFDHVLGHGVKPITDSLAVYDLFFRLDKNTSLDTLLQIFNQSSNEANVSLEYLVQSIGKVFGVTLEPMVTDQRESLHANIDLIRKSNFFAQGENKYSVKLTADVAAARTDFGNFLTLYYALPFVLSGNNQLLSATNADLYNLWIADQNLSTVDRQNGKANFSNEWYADRANYLALLQKRNTNDIDASESTNPSGKDVFYVSVDGFNNGSGRIFSGNVDANNINQEPVPPRIIFGTNDSNTPANTGPDGFVGGNGNDRIYGLGGDDKLNGLKGHDVLDGGAGKDELLGGEGTDLLVGGVGDDTLDGGAGNDLLKGGADNDTYQFTDDFGRDTVVDSDGSGEININGTLVAELKPLDGTDDIYSSNNIDAVTFNDGASDNLLLITRPSGGARSNSVLIKNWHEGDLGIQILQPEDGVINNATTGTFNGDTAANVIDIWDFRQTLLGSDVDAAPYINLIADGKGGDDFLMGALNGSDTLKGGADDDFILGGNQLTGVPGNEGLYMLQHLEIQGSDQLYGDAGSDYIVVTGKNSVAHGGSENDFIRADQYLWAEFSPFEADGGVSAGDDYDVSENQIWEDFSKFLQPQYIYNENFIQLTEFNPGITSLDWSAPQTSVSGSTYIYIQRPGTVNPNTIYATTHYGEGRPGFDVSVTGREVINGSFQVKWNSGSYIDNANLRIADYQDMKGHNLYGDEGDDVVWGGVMSDYISGGQGKDTLFGLDGHDIIDGGTEDDEIRGGTGDDVIMGGAGNDVIHGGGIGLSSAQMALSDDDVIYGGEGKDDLNGDEGNDYLDGGGGVGEDSLRGGKGNDYLYGGDDDVKDILSGGEDDDTIVIGKFDHVSGDGGDDLYIWRPYQSVVGPLAIQAVSIQPEVSASTSIFAAVAVSAVNSSPTEITNIIDSEGNNTLALVGEQDFSNFAVDKSATHLVLGAGNNKILLQDALAHAPMNIITGSSVEALAEGKVQVKSITDDTFLNGTDLVAGQQISTTALMLSNLQRAVNVTAAVSNTYLAGGLIDDTLTGHVNGSRFIGGKGNDTYHGDVGDDTYLIRKGDGHDIITEQGGNNALKLDINIAADQVLVNRVDADLLVRVSNEQTITIKNMFDSATGALLIENAIQSINFYDGTVWDISGIKQQALTGSISDDIIGGFESNDVVIGGKGNDQLSDLAGDDVYQYALGDGNDVIADASGNDRIELSTGILPNQVIALRDAYNNLILKFADGKKITVASAFDSSGNFTAQAIETIQFSDASTWDAARILQEVAAHTTQNINGTNNDDVLLGDAVNDIFTGGKGDDRILGDAGDDTYRYTLGDGKDVIVDIAGVDRIELNDISQDQLVARSNGRDLILSFTDGGSLTVSDMFVSKSQTPVDPLITQIIQELQTNWIAQAEALIEQHYGLVGNGEITLNFERNGVSGVNKAHVEVVQAGSGNTPAKLILSINLDAYAVMPNGSGPWYHDRNIAHEMVHAVMASNMNLAGMPGWFAEGTAEFIHGADESVRNEMGIISNQGNFNLLFKTTTGSPTTNAGYAVSYIAVKLLDQEIRDNGGIGIKELFDQLQSGKTLDQALTAVSLAHNGMNGQWNNLTSFESHFKTVGFTSMDTLLNLNNADTGSIAGSDYGFSPLDANSVLSNIPIGPSKNFTIIIPDEYTNSVGVHNEIESIRFADQTIWNAEQIRQEVIKGRLFGTGGNDTIHAFDSNDVLSGAKGDDQLFGYAGNDIYRYALGDGNDVIVDSAGIDQIELGSGILESNVVLSRSQGNLIIGLSTEEKITVLGMFDAATGAIIPNAAIEKIQFSNNKVWDLNYIKQVIAKPLALQGTDNADTLVGSDANDILIGGRGNDSLAGLYGDDTYQVNLGDGADTIVDNGGLDSIKFGEGIFEGNVNFNQYGLVIKSNTGEQRVYFNYAAIEKIEFANGNMWDAAYMQSEAIKGTAGNDEIVGFKTNEVFTGGKGNDTIHGGDGDDTYLFNRGDGIDRIRDSVGISTIRFGLGINESDVTVRYDSWGIASFYLNTGERVDFGLSTNPEGAQVGGIQFAGGASWDAARIYRESIKGSSGADYIYSFSGNDTINGGAGADTIVSGAGNDVINGGLGFDSLEGRAGDDTYQFARGDGVDLIEDSGGVDTIQFLSGISPSDVALIKVGENLFISIAGSNNSIQITNQFLNGSLNPSSAIEKITFLDETIWDSAMMEQKIVESTQNPALIVGGKYGDEIHLAGTTDYVIYGMGGNDDISGGDGNDTLIGGNGINFLDGGKGNNTYFINDEAGTQIVTSFANASGQTNRILFSDAVSKDDVQVRLAPQHRVSSIENGVAYYRAFESSIRNIVLTINKQSVYLGDDFRHQPYAAQDFGFVEFYDGEKWDINELLRRSSTRVPMQPTAQFDTTGQYITGVAEPRAVVSVKNTNGVELGTDLASASDGYFSIRLPTALIQSETVNVTATNIEGNTSVVKSIAAPSIDVTPPAQPSAALDSTGKIIYGISEAGSIVSVKTASGIEIGCVRADATSGVYEITLLTALTQQDIVYVTAKDQAGNASIQKSITLPNLGTDITPPAQPTAIFDTIGKVVSGVAEAGSVVVVKDANNTNTLGTVTADATTGAYSITLVTALINKETVNVTATDAEGNVSAIKSIIAPDKTAPALPTANFDIAGKVISGTAEAGSVVVVKDANNTNTLGTVTADATTGAYSITLVTALINKETVNVTATDAEDNVSAIKSIIAPDKTAPVLPTANFDIAGKVISGTAEAGGVVIVKDANNASTLGTVTADATTGAYSITLVTALINKETVNVTATDAAGNVSAIKAIIAPDKTAPALPTATFDSAGKVISGTAEAGSVVVVKNASNTSTLGTVTAHATTGAYSITLPTALVNKETVNVTATDTAGNTSVARAVVAPGGTVPNPAPITIQAENYTAMNGIQKENTSDAGGGQNVGYIDAGDWMAYGNATFRVPAAGRYRVTYRVASLNGGGRLTLRELSNDGALGSIAVPRTGGWQTWVDVTQEITLGGGDHSFKLAADSGGFNVNWFKLEPVAPVAQDTTPPAQPTAVFDSQGKVISGIAEAGSVVVVKNASNTSTLGTVTAHATTGAYSITLPTALVNKETVNVTATDTAGNTSVARAVVAPGGTVPNPAPITIQAENYTAMNGIQKENTSDAGGGQNVGYIDAGDWMAYGNATFRVPAAGRYRVTYRVASLNGGGRLTLRELSNDGALGSSIAVPRTGGWQTWVDVTQEITLSGGDHSFKLAADSGGFNVNWFKLEPVTPTAFVNTLMKADDLLSDDDALSGRLFADLTDRRVNQLVNAIAAFNPSVGVGSVLAREMTDQVSQVLATTWQ